MTVHASIIERPPILVILFVQAGSSTHHQARLSYQTDIYAKAVVNVCRKVNAAAAAAGG